MTEPITIHDATGSWVYESPYSSDPEIAARERAKERKEYEAWRKAKLAQMAGRRNHQAAAVTTAAVEEANCPRRASHYGAEICLACGWTGPEFWTSPATSQDPQGTPA